MSHARSLTLLSAAVATLAVAWAGHARAEVADHELKAAFVLRFGSFVSWPSAAFPTDSPFVIGVLAGHPMRTALDQIAWGQESKGRPVVVRSVDSLAEAQAVHVMFVGRSESKRTGELLEALRTRSVVTISDVKGFASRGGVIELVEGSRGSVRFEINLASAESCGLTISSKLLRIAKRVYRDPPPTAPADIPDSR